MVSDRIGCLFVFFSFANSSPAGPSSGTDDAEHLEETLYGVLNVLESQ